MTAAVSPARRGRRGPLVMLVKIVVLLFCIWLAVQALRTVDWAQVGHALGQLNAWQILAVVALIAVRQSVNAYTLIVLLPKVSIRHALTTAFSGTLIQTFMPPPTDSLLRMSILNSYGIPATRAAAGLVLDTIVFYMARFAAPLVALVIALIALPIESVYVWLALGGAVALAVMIWSLALISGGERVAEKFGRTAGRLVRRIRKTVDPEGWAAALVRFQRESAEGMARRTSRAVLVMLAFIAVDATVVVVGLRFSGIPSSDISYLAVFVGLFCLYPLTIFPFAGLGVLDASLIVLINSQGVADSADLVAALVIWRAATLLLPLVPGLGALLWWRHSHPGRSLTGKTAGPDVGDAEVVPLTRPPRAGDERPA